MLNFVELAFMSYASSGLKFLDGSFSFQTLFRKFAQIFGILSLPPLPPPNDVLFVKALS